MQKYGFREGQGLGKHEQGLSTALSVEKTSKRGGKIIVGDAAEKRNYAPPCSLSLGASLCRRRSASVQGSHGSWKFDTSSPDRGSQGMSLPST